MSNVPPRRSLDETWSFLEKDGLAMPRRTGGDPFVPSVMPRQDDEELGFSFFRGKWEAADFSDMTLPRTFFGRSFMESVRFSNSDLSESRMCWNDFDTCDFTGADLSGCDMRASRFKGCKFAGANLRGADFRHSGFQDCDFEGADLTGATATESEDLEASELYDCLTEEQQAVMHWPEDSGPEPEGG